MPYKEFKPRDTLEEALSKLWGAAKEFVPTTRMEEIICMIANAQPTGIHAVPDIEEGDTGKVLTASEDGAVWASGGGGGSGAMLINAVVDGAPPTLDKTWSEIKTAMESGIICYIKSDNSEDDYNMLYEYITGVSDTEGYYINTIASNGTENAYVAQTANDYPALSLS